MLDRYLGAADLPAAIRKPEVLELLGKAMELCWWDGFHRGVGLASLAFLALTGGALILRAKSP